MVHHRLTTDIDKLSLYRSISSRIQEFRSVCQLMRQRELPESEIYTTNPTMKIRNRWSSKSTRLKILELNIPASC